MDSENSLATAEAHFGKLLNSRTIPALGGFRMLAVFSVVLAHAGYSGLFSARHGVSGFFVLSGFLITWLLLQEYETHKTVSLKHFFLRRAYRIFPAYYAFLAFSISMDLWRGNSDIEPLIWPGVFYLVNYYNAIEGHASASIAHAWSLAVEEQFYLIWPVLFLFLVRRGQAWLVAGLLGLILLVASWRSIAFSVLDLGPSYVYNAFDTRFDNLAVGCLLAVLLKRQLFQRIGTVLAWWAWTPLVTLALLHLSRQVSSAHYAYGPAFTLDAVLMAVLLVQLIQLGQGRWWCWLNHRVAVYFGAVSYPLYLYHIWGLQIGRKLTAALPVTFQLGTGIMVGLLMAMASYHLIERPLLEKKVRYTPSLSRDTPS